MAALRWIGRRPTLWVELAVAASWLALLLGVGIARGAGGGSNWEGGPLWICTMGLRSIGHAAPPEAGSVSMASAPLLAGTPMWALMALAMMAPTALPAVRHVAVNSIYWRRRRAGGEFFLAFLAIWTGFGVLVVGQLAAWAPARSPYALIAALLAATLWQLTPFKLRAQLACHRSRPLPPRGWRAHAGVLNFALHNGGACLASCWAMMIVAGVAGAGQLLWMAALTGAMTAEKRAERPRRAARRVAALLAAAAAGVAAATVL